LIPPAEIPEVFSTAFRDLAEAGDERAVAAAVLAPAASLVGAEAASLWVLDEKSDELVFFPMGEANPRRERPWRLKVGEGLAGWAAARRKAVVVNDAPRDPRWSPKGDRQTGFKTRQVAAAPLVVRGALLGVLEAVNKGSGGFTESDGELLRSFALPAALALENVRLAAHAREESGRFTALFAQASDGILSLDPQGRIQRINVAAARLFALDPDKTMGRRTVQELSSLYAVTPPWPTVLGSPTPVELEFERRRGKPLILAGKSHPLGSGGCLLVVRDVTETRREEALKRGFLALISHKLRTPLVTIAGYAPFLLKSAGNLSEFQRKALGAIGTQGRFLSGLVDRLLNFTVLESGALNLDLRSVRLDRAVEGAVSLMGGVLTGRRVAVAVDAGVGEVPPVLADEDRLEEILRNLIENAVKFNNKADPRLRFSAAVEPSGQVRLNVEDNGPGIPAEERQRLFQKFYQIEESFTGQVEGAGLGLALVKHLVEAMGGRVGVKSVLRQGSTFYFTLPPAKGQR
jgi:two-component system phosphate regulon sensor histidine kinase PhoR